MREAINQGFIRSRDPSLDEKVITWVDSLTGQTSTFPWQDRICLPFFNICYVLSIVSHLTLPSLICIPQVFAERPLTSNIAEALVRDVMYLVALGTAMKTAMLNVVFRASDICLGELRDTRDEERWQKKFEVRWILESRWSRDLNRTLELSRNMVSLPLLRILSYFHLITRPKKWCRSASSNSLVTLTEVSTHSAISSGEDTWIAVSTTAVSLLNSATPLKPHCLLFRVTILSPTAVPLSRRNQYPNIFNFIDATFPVSCRRCSRKFVCRSIM